MENNQTKEKLLAEIGRLKKELKKKKKYGLVWEDKPEDVVEMCKEKLPVLREVKSKEIITDKNKPVNLLIEGDNYHALSVLNYTHKGKIDVIYIDPPYNTGNKDFKYNDHYVDIEDSYRHSKWLSFMSKRLRLAKTILNDTGFIFLSIDDNELSQLKILCDEIFGSDNFIANIVRKRRNSQANLSKNISTIHEYLLCYAKNNRAQLNRIIPLHNEDNYKNPDNDTRGAYVTMPCTNKGGAKYIITTPTNVNYEDEWRFKKETYDNLLADNRIVFPRNGSGKPRYKLFLKEKNDAGSIPNSWWDDAATNQEATAELKNIFGNEIIFNNPKPVGLITRILKLSTDKQSTILDFMAGSGTTGHAVLELNKEDDGNRQFILCTNNELNGFEKELREKGLNEKEIQEYGICRRVTYPRLEKVIEGYKNSKGEKIEGLGGNLKYFKTDFVDYKESTDRNKIKLTKEAVEMLCIKEGTFELVTESKEFKIFKNQDHCAGIIFDQLVIKDFKKVIKDIKGKISVYVFSLGDDSFEDEFEDIKQKVKLSPIPEAILKVYRRIYK